MRKLLQLTGIIEVILALILSFLMFQSVKQSEAATTILSGGGAMKIALFVSLGIFPATVLLGGILGIIGRGRRALQMFGILMIFSAVQNGALMLLFGSGTIRSIYLILLVVCIADSAIYLLSACVHKRPPKPGRPGEKDLPPAPPEE